MKNVILFTGLTMLLLFNSCNKTPIFFPGVMKNGWSEATKNGKKWKTSADAGLIKQLPDYIAINFATFNEEGSLREELSLYKIPLKVGLYEVKGRITADTIVKSVESFYGTLRSDGDVDEDSYYLDENEKSTLEVVKYDETTKTISGKYKTYFTIKPPKINPKNPDKVRFTDGTFEVKITW
jgi:hypothetical protein